MVSLEQPRALAAGAINPLDSSRAFIICSCVYLRYGRLGLSTLTSSVMLSFFWWRKCLNLLINSDCSTPYVRYAAICALPSRQQPLYLVALCVRADRTDPTQLLLLIHATTPPLLFCELGLSLCETVCQYLGAKLGVSDSHSGSGLGCFAALARASRLAPREALNWFLRRLLISTSKPSRSPTMRPCVYSPGRAPSPTPHSRGGGISYARVLPPCLANRCLRAVLSSP